MSFLTGEEATANVIAQGNVKYIAWEQEKLKSLKQLNPDLLIKIQNILGKDLTMKLKKVPRKNVGNIKIEYLTKLNLSVIII